MRSKLLLNRFVAVALLFSTVLVTMPVSAAELAAPRISLGSVSGAGSVSLRGVSIPQEGTIFSGDVVQVGSQGYAKVMLVAGHRLQLDIDTKISIRETDKNIFVQVTAGNVAFTRSGTSQLTLNVGPYELIPERNASGNAAFIGQDAFGLRSLKGKVTVRQTALHTSYTLGDGQERILTFAGLSTQPIAQLASNVPAPLPTIPPVPVPQATPAAAKGLSTTGWVAILATIGGATAAIAVLATRGNNEEETAAILARQKVVQGTQTAATAATGAQTTATSLSSAATATQNALATVPNATTRAQLTAQTQAIINSANQSAAQLAQLQIQLANLQAQIPNTTGAALVQLTAQINQVIAQINAISNTLNQQIAQLNTIIAQGNAAGGTVPQQAVPLAPTAPTIFASGSTP